MRDYFFIVWCGLVALALVSCGGSDPPTAPGQAVASPLPITRVAVTGIVPLTAIGQTVQLTATATYSDTTTSDVTATATWISNDDAVVTVSSAGLLTVVGFGQTVVRAAVRSREGAVEVTAKPPNSFLLLGRAREPGNSGIPGVRVLNTRSGESVLTDDAGRFSFVTFTTGRLTFEKAGFESVQLDPVPDVFTDVPLQQIVRVVAGAPVDPISLRLAPHDVSYLAGTDRCYPCKLIRVTMPRSGNLHVGLEWDESRAPALNVWVRGTRFAGTGTSSIVTDVRVNAGEVLVYVGLYNPEGRESTTYVPISLAISAAP